MNKNGAIGVIFCVRKFGKCEMREMRNAKCEKCENVREYEKCEKPEKHGARGHVSLVNRHVGLGAEVYSVKKLFFCTKKYCTGCGYMVY